MTTYGHRKEMLRPSHVRRLQSAIAQAEEPLLLGPSLPGEADALRLVACEQVVELQETLSRLRRMLAPGESGPPVESSGAGAAWLAPARPRVSVPPLRAERRHSAILGRRVFEPLSA